MQCKTRSSKCPHYARVNPRLELNEKQYVQQLANIAEASTLMHTRLGRSPEQASTQSRYKHLDGARL